MSSRGIYLAYRGLTALAIRFEGLVRRGDVRDYADLARLGCVTRARITQIMNLLHLAPDIQEALLFLPPHAPGPRPDLREGRPSHRRRPPLAPAAQNVGDARRRTLALQYSDGNHHKGIAGPAQVRLQGPGSPHLSWRLRKYVPRHTSSNAASSRATLNRLRETHRTSGSLHPFCRTLRT